MLKLYAQPYNIDATGFFFESYEEYEEKQKACFDDYGSPVEEFEIQLIDGDDIDAEFSHAITLDQANLSHFLYCVENLDDEQKKKIIIASRDLGYYFNHNTNPDELDIDIYYYENMELLALEFVEDGILGDIPDTIKIYLDYGKIARDLEMEYSETQIAGQNIIYRAS